MAGRDDDALSWGDDDPTLHTGVGSAVPPGLPDGYTAVGKDSDTVGRREADGTITMSADPVALGSAALVTLGILGGVYALWTIGWIIGGLRVHGVAGLLVSSDGSASPLWSAGNLVAVWLAVLAPAIWFAIVLWLTRGSRPWLRWLLLFVGAVLLVPWPFIMVGAVGA